MRLSAASPIGVTYVQLKWMAACLALALAAYATSLPAWLLLAVAAMVAIRLGLAARGYAAPARALRLCIALASIAMLFVQLHTFNGLAAGSTLLSLVAGLKFFETQTRRDLYAVALIVYFLSLAALLHSESFWLFAYVVAVSWLTTAALLRLSPSTHRPQWPRSMRYAGRLSAQALPVALVFWLFFPRFDGPLWNMPTEGHGAESGLSDSMSPGDITDLALSDEIAFRVHFIDATPAHNELYWRGPVLHDFDGHTWRRSAPGGTETAAPLLPVGPGYRYRLSLEPHQHNWLFALDWPDRWDVPGGAHLTSDYMLVQQGPVARTLEIDASSHTHVEASESLSAANRQRDTWLPPTRNPRTIAFSKQLRLAHADDLDFARAILEMFHREQFFYTLEPPPLESDSVDGFLFDTKRGFCGHYASAFATLMRAAGIPTRVVTGYQGGTFNRFSDYWILRQSNAHAWDEIWIEGSGWLRIDPTSAVAAARVERGAEDALGANEPLTARWRHLSWLSDLRLRFDAMGQLWRKRILSFDQLSQERLLERLGVPEPDGQKVVMALAAGLVLAFSWLVWQVRREQRPQPKDPLVRAYARLCRKLAAVGLARRPHEGAEAFAARVAFERPDLAQPVTLLCRRYSRLRYGMSHPSAAPASFASRVRAFRPKRTR